MGEKQSGWGVHRTVGSMIVLFGFRNLSYLSRIRILSPKNDYKKTQDGNDRSQLYCDRGNVDRDYDRLRSQFLASFFQK